MIKEIVRDPLFLAQKSDPASALDSQVITDLVDTLRANRERCVGMAANMIGVRRAIIVIAIGAAIVPLLNPVITRQKGKYETEEGCLSLTGTRRCTRYRSIEVDYLDEHFRPQHARYTGWAAQIIQHELDHIAGIVI